MATNYTPPEGAGQQAVIDGLTQADRVLENPQKVYDKAQRNEVRNQATVNELTNELARLQNLQSGGVDEASGNPFDADQLASLQSSIDDVQARLDFRQGKLQNNQATSAMAQQELLKQSAAADRDLLNKSATSPEDLIATADVAGRKDINTNGMDIKKGTGVAGKAPTINASTVNNIKTAEDPKKLSAHLMKPAIVDNLKKMAAAKGADPEKIKAASLNPNKLAQLALGITEAEVANVDVATMDPNTLAQLGLDAAQIQANRVEDFGRRELQAGELIDGSSVNMDEANAASQVTAEQGQLREESTVQGQMSKLMKDFEQGPPPWAAGAMRAANQALAARGLGASSMAGQAVVQAAMEAALPIAQIDAQLQAEMDTTNLSNRQQAALASAKYRAEFLGQKFDQEFKTKVSNAAAIADVANMNFTADQQVALENARIVSSTNIANLGAKNAKILADAAALSQVDLTNLANQQQSNVVGAQLEGDVNLANAASANTKMLSDAAAMSAAEQTNVNALMTARVENAKNFLQMDLANLTNEQQAKVISYQGRIQTMLSNQAAENSARQFNAASKNQVDQFMADLSSRISQFNAEQTNSIRQTNVSEKNKVKALNQAVKAQRQEFNSTNRLVIAQANAQWRQDLGLEEMRAQNQANLNAAKDLNGLTMDKLDQIWQRERDIMSFAFAAGQAQEDRDLQLLLGDRDLEAAKKAGLGKLAGMLLEPVISKGFDLITGLF